MTHRTIWGSFPRAVMGTGAVVKIEDNVLTLYAEHGEMKIDRGKVSACDVHQTDVLGVPNKGVGHADRCLLYGRD